jgi:hypothetical protein
MPRIYFDSDKAWRFLMAHGYVITMRAHKAVKKEPPLLVRNVQVFRHGAKTRYTVNRLFLKTIAASDWYTTLPKMVKHSGFMGKGEWVVEAERLSGAQSSWDAFYVHLVPRDAPATTGGGGAPGRPGPSGSSPVPIVKKGKEAVV